MSSVKYFAPGVEMTEFQSIFYCCDVCSWCTYIINADEAVAAYCQSGSVWFQLVWFVGYHNSSVGDFSEPVLGDIGFGDEEDGVGARYVADSLCQAPEFVC